MRRIVEYYGDNRSITEIARLEKLSRPTVRRWLADEGIVIREERVDTPAQRETKVRKQKLATIVADTITMAEANVEHLGLKTVRERLGQIKALIKAAMVDVAAGDVGGSALAKLGELEIKYARECEELERAARPPEKPDPNKDPAAAETVNKLIAKLEALVVHEEKVRG